MIVYLVVEEECGLSTMKNNDPAQLHLFIQKDLNTGSKN